MKSPCFYSLRLIRKNEFHLILLLLEGLYCASNYEHCHIFTLKLAKFPEASVVLDERHEFLKSFRNTENFPQIVILPTPHIQVQRVVDN